MPSPSPSPSAANPPRPPPDLPHVLCVETALASLESALRRGIAPDPLSRFHPLEKLADLYLARPAGHRLDNIDRALASYSLASKTAACALQPSADLDRARLSAKLANCWYLRLQYVSRNCSDFALLKRAHLSAAADAIDIALQRYEDCLDWQHDRDQWLVYKHALLCKGFIYHALCANADVHSLGDVQSDAVDPQEKQQLWRRMYINSCIQSLEKALFSDASEIPAHQPPVNETKSDPPAPNNPQRPSNDCVHKSAVRVDIQNVTKARAVLCLARAYVDTSNTVSEKVSEALHLLGGVEQMLDHVDVNKHYDGFMVMEDDLQRMKEDAKCLERLLKQRRSASSDGGCVIS